MGLERKKLELEPKYLLLLGYASHQSPQKQAEQEVQGQRTDKPVLERKQTNRSGQQEQERLLRNQRKRITTPYKGTKTNFTIVTYVQEGQAASAILLAQNIAAKLPSEYLLIYDLGVSEEELRPLNAYCNTSRCSVISYDLSEFPSFVNDQRTHAYRPIVIKDALRRAKSILFAENYMRIRGGYRELLQLLQSRVNVTGVLGWNTPTAVSSRTHPKMFDYFESDAEDFIFLRMVDLDAVFFVDSEFVTEKILLPWLKCALTLECIDPIGKFFPNWIPITRPLIDLFPWV